MGKLVSVKTNKNVKGLTCDSFPITDKTLLEQINDYADKVSSLSLPDAKAFIKAFIEANPGPNMGIAAIASTTRTKLYNMPAFNADIIDYLDTLD